MPPDQILAALGDLEVAHEELRVAEEELAEQREQIERLVARHDSSQRWRDHLFGLLPMGLLVTDAEGKILEANASAADLLGVRPVHLPGKPLIVYVETRQRRQVRDLLGRLAHGETGQLTTVTLTPRIGEPFAADLIALPDPEGQRGTLRWVVLPTAAHAGPSTRLARAIDGEPSAESLAVATALAQLFTLPVETPDQQRLLAQIALVVGAAVPGATAVSITIGDPVVPDRVASDSVDAQVFDGMQLRLGEGPCVDAFRLGTAVVCTDILGDARW